jgi:HPt (histidine-containing phosphotransfer) domain-containing protein
MGFDDYLSKPIEIAKLDEIVAHWVPKEKQRPAGLERKVIQGEAQFDIPGIDTKKGIAMNGGLLEGYKQVLSQFCRDAEKRLPLFDEASPAESGEIAIHAHAIKSAAGTIGADVLSKAAAGLEAAGKAGDDGAIRRDLPGFAAKLKETMENIRQALGEGSEEAGGGEDLGAFFAELKTALEKKDMEAIDDMIRRIKDSNPGAKAKQALLDIEDKVLMSKFREAAAAAAELV